MRDQLIGDELVSRIRLRKGKEICSAFTGTLLADTLEMLKDFKSIWLRYCLFRSAGQAIPI